MPCACTHPPFTEAEAWTEQNIRSGNRHADLSGLDSALDVLRHACLTRSGAQRVIRAAARSEVHEVRVGGADQAVHSSRLVVSNSIVCIATAIGIVVAAAAAAASTSAPLVGDAPSHDLHNLIEVLREQEGARGREGERER